MLIEIFNVKKISFNESAVRQSFKADHDWSLPFGRDLRLKYISLLLSTIALRLGHELLHDKCPIKFLLANSDNELQLGA